MAFREISKHRAYGKVSSNSPPSRRSLTSKQFWWRCRKKSCHWLQGRIFWDGRREKSSKRYKFLLISSRILVSRVVRKPSTPPPPPRMSYILSDVAVNLYNFIKNSTNPDVEWQNVQFVGKFPLHANVRATRRNRN